MPAPPTVINSPTPPVGPADGDLWFNVLTGREYVWYISPTSGGAWVQTQPSSAAIQTPHDPQIVPATPLGTTPNDITRAPLITVSPVPPSGATPGDLWWSPITGIESVFFNDGNTIQWVTTQPVKYINISALFGDAGGDLTGLYPNPQIVPDVVMDTPQISALPSAALDDLHLVPAQWVKDRLTDVVGVPIPVKSVAYGDIDGSIKGDATLLSFDEPTKVLTVNGGTVAAQLGQFSGAVSFATAAPGTSTTQGATTAFVSSAITALNLGTTYAPIASPTFTGDPKAPTPSLGDSDTSIATTAFVQSTIGALNLGTTYAPIASPTFTGDPKAPTPATADNDTSIATTAFVKAQGYGTGTLTGVTAGTGISVTGSAPSPTVNLANLVTAAGPIGDATHTPVITINAQGQVTALTQATISGGGGGASVTVSDTAPGSPSAGNLWWESDTGQLYIFYVDPGGAPGQWVQTTPVQQQQPAVTGWRQLGAVSPSGVATVDFTGIPSDINHLKMFFQIVPATNDVHWAVQYYDNTGALMSGSSYGWSNTLANHLQATGANIMGNSSTGAAYTAGIVLTYGSGVNNGVSANGNEGLNGHCEIYNIRSASTRKTLTYQSSYLNGNATAVYELTGGGRPATTTAITGLRLYSSTGAYNIASGLVTLWGSP